MKLICHFILLIFFSASTNSNVYKILKENIQALLPGLIRTENNVKTNDYFPGGRRHGSIEGNDPEDVDDTESIAFGKRLVWEDKRERADFKPSGRVIKVQYQERDEETSRQSEDKENKEVSDEETYYKNQQKDKDDVKTAKIKAEILKKEKKREARLNRAKYFSFGDIDKTSRSKEHYHMDPVLNVMRSGARKSVRRRASQRRAASSSDSSSSSREVYDWKDKFKEQWMHKKFEAMNSSAPKGDVVNMVAARPWGVPCGDPNQHDMPWGTCMLAMECEAEYRIYRGDYFCGRTTFVCCALQLSTYDMYQGFDVSFEDKSLSTESDERKDRKKSSKEKKYKKREKEKNKRRHDRVKRKRKIKRNIKKIITEIRKILSRQYKNGTTQRKKRTKQLKAFITYLKNQYKKDRMSVKELHAEDMIRLDSALMEKLNQIKELNNNFMKNDTFREIVAKGTITKNGARMLLQAYPELNVYLATRRNEKPKFKDYLQYDVDYGLNFD